MKLIIIQENKDVITDSDKNLLRFAISNEPVASIVLGGLNKILQLNGDKDTVVAIPNKWGSKTCVTLPKVECRGENIIFSSEHLRKLKRKPWFVISDGRFVTQIERKFLENVLAKVQADVVAVNAEPELLAYREKTRLAAQNKVAGFRRLYSDSAEFAPIPNDWPHHLFIKTDVLIQLLNNRILPNTFCDLLKLCRSNALNLRAVNVGGSALNLETEYGLLKFCTSQILSNRRSLENSYSTFNSEPNVNGRIPQSSRIIGKVVLGKNAHIGQKVIVKGPSIICNDAEIAQGAVINSSILGPNVSVPKNQLIWNRVLIDQVDKRSTMPLGLFSQHHPQNSKRTKKVNITTSINAGDIYKNSHTNNFRTWPRLSYARCFKRIVDIVAAIIVLIFFAPFLPIIALAIKLSSRGPVFFKDTRQGIYGKKFNCLKFRTMLVGADKIQEKLRALNQADGPQFMIEDDPRVNATGRFLRETYIDEIPQFFNVLMGQMSVVGPRPSPESENMLCPSWRDARLSIRPGITGLWQVCRTRQPMRDFQEWIHYDIKYIRNLTLKLDLWVCWQTIKKIVKNFAKQF